ncbi:MAG: LysM peptidoglycan-binding domain-containing protein [Bacteroidales bacterium]|nr:LysM peptidoglycan-binding domain-containing protein [Bacteroidales bacterium]
MKIKIIILFVFLGFGNLLFAQDYAAVKTKETINENGKVYYIHTVVKGNTLYNISKAYEVSPDLLRKYNKDIDNGLKLGLELKIPKSPSSEQAFIYHIVKAKETLYQISKIYNVSVDDIVLLNSIKGKVISEGQYLKIPSSDSLSSVKKTALAGEIVQDDYDKEKYIKYKVQPKETLFSIGKRFGISVDALMYINDLSVSSLSLGQELLIPIKLVQDKDKQAQDADKFITHKVKPQETLYGIAREYAVSVSDIRKNNEFGDREIQIGQTIRIPRELNNTGYIKHQVTHRREKLSKIAAEYNMSVTDLNKANPNIHKKAKKGQSVLIPLGFIETDFDQEKAIPESGVIVLPDNDTVADVHEKLICEKNIEQTKTYQIALMIPLNLSEVDTLLGMTQRELLNNSKSKAFRFIEFYEGALLAAQEMKESGFDFKGYVYDIPRDVNETAKVLNNPKLQDMDLIISLSYSDSFELISEFSKTYDIPLVNALSKRREIIYNNTNVFKVEPQADYLYTQTADYITNNYPNHNVIIVRSNQYQLAKQTELFVNSLREAQSKLVGVSNYHIARKMDSYHKIEKNAPENEDLELTTGGLNQSFEKKVRNEHRDFNYEQIESSINDTLMLVNDLEMVIYSKDSLAGVVRASSLLRENLIVAIGQDEIFAIELFTQLNSVSKNYQYEVVGLPFWDGFNNLDVSYTQPKKLKIVNHRFVDYSKPEVIQFVKNFRAAYGIEPEIRKHAFLGYDLTKYFLTALKDYGNNFTNCLDYMEVDLLQNQLRFEDKEGRGYENINWNIIEQSDYNWYRVD